MAVETRCKLRKAGGSMVENNRLPDTPWHVGYAKKQEDDPRRHKARCIHYRDGQCGWKANYSGKCIGSSHCMDYSESLEDFKKLQESKKTAEQIERDNIDKYKKSLEPKKEQLERSNNPYKYRKCSELNRCLVCDEHLYKEKYSLKRCKYCGMFYVDIDDSTRDEIMDIVKADPIFVMNIKRK